MKAIDWRPTQKALRVLQDGVPGDQTFVALLNVVASPAADKGDVLAMARALKSFAVPLASLVSPVRMAGFISNCANESGGFVKWSEGLNYSAQRMADVWPSRYSTTGKKGGAPNSRALRLVGNPIAFANDVYGGRMGNERDGLDDNDGYDFRGLGPMQTTGYDNFAACERHTGIPFSTQPGLMAHPGTGTIGALSWWSRSGCNAWLDQGNPKAARSLANAGRADVANPEGWPTVSAYHARLLEVLK